MSKKVILKRIALYILALVGYASLLPLWPGRRKHKLVVLRYHSISDFRRHEVNVKVSAFRSQMEHLAKNFTVLSLRHGLGLLNNLPNRAVAITFDDGYKDNFTNAYPILKSLKIPATIFLTAGFIGKDKVLNHDRGDNPLYNQLLSWEEVKEMAKGGIDFGSHTLTHANLNNTNSLMSEIADSKRIIEKELGAKISGLSYPFGLVRDYNDCTKRLANEAGYSFGCSAMNGTNDERADLFELRRIGIESSDTMFTFRAKLNGALDLLEIKDWPMFNWVLRGVNRVVGA
jgi:peptidoglycan/xylan/chitin deacetylase (PgdA/CDA1 family)